MDFSNDPWSAGEEVYKFDWESVGASPSHQISTPMTSPISSFDRRESLDNLSFSSASICGPPTPVDDTVHQHGPRYGLPITPSPLFGGFRDTAVDSQNFDHHTQFPDRSCAIYHHASVPLQTMEAFHVEGYQPIYSHHSPAPPATCVHEPAPMCLRESFSSCCSSSNSQYELADYPDLPSQSFSFYNPGHTQPMIQYYEDRTVSPRHTMSVRASPSATSEDASMSEDYNDYKSTPAKSGNRMTAIRRLTAAGRKSVKKQNLETLARRHQKTNAAHKSPRKEKHPCKYCHRVLRRQEHRKRHEITVHGSEPEENLVKLECPLAHHGADAETDDACTLNKRNNKRKVTKEGLEIESKEPGASRTDNFYQHCASHVARKRKSRNKIVPKEFLYFALRKDFPDKAANYIVCIENALRKPDIEEGEVDWEFVFKHFYYSEWILSQDYQDFLIRQQGSEESFDMDIKPFMFATHVHSKL